VLCRQDQFQTLYKAATVSKNKYINVTYVEKATTDFDTDFVQALADGVGPDVVILRDDSFYKNRNRLLVIPYTSYSERTFKDTFTQETEMFLSPNGVTLCHFTLTRWFCIGTATFLPTLW
jgi:hypothetical protein